MTSSDSSSSAPTPETPSSSSRPLQRIYILNRLDLTCAYDASSQPHAVQTLLMDSYAVARYSSDANGNGIGRDENGAAYTYSSFQSPSVASETPNGLAVTTRANARVRIRSLGSVTALPSPLVRTKTLRHAAQRRKRRISERWRIRGAATLIFSHSSASRRIW